MEIGGVTLFILVLLMGAFSVLFGLPGTVLIVVDAIAYAAITGFKTIGFKILATLLILSVLAEFTDFAVGMAGAEKFRFSRAKLWAFLIGGAIGAALMTPLLLGLGIFLGVFLGGFALMMMVELHDRNRLKPAFRTPWGAVLGGAAGICVKGFFALVMVIITLTGVYS